MNSRLLRVFLTAVLLLTSWAVRGQIVTYSFNGSLGSETTLPPDAQPTNAAASDMSRGSGVSPSNAANTFSSNGWSTGALDVNDYYEFTATPNAGFELDLTSLVFSERRSGTGIRTFEIRSSLDGYSTTIGAPIGVPDNTSTRTQTIILPSPTFENLTSAITFRIYGYNAEGATGTWRIDNVNLNGAVVLGTPPSTNDQTTEVFAPTTQVMGGNLSSTDDTEPEAVDVFAFDIEDQASGDGLPTQVTNLRIQPHSTNTANWTDHIQGLTLTGSSLGAITIGTPTITDTEIDIPITSGNLDVNDGALETITLAIYLNSTNIQDNVVFSCYIDDAASGFTADPGGSDFASPFPMGDVVSSDFDIQVEGTELQYQQQPSDVTVNTAMAPAVEVAVTDENGNVDEDFAASVSISSTPAFSSATTPVSPVNGVASFGDIQYASVQTGVILTATASGLSVASDAFDVVASAPVSDLIITGIVDGNLSGGNPKGIELYACGTVDLSDYEVWLSANGGTFGNIAVGWSGTFTNQFIYLSNDASEFSTVFGSSGDFANLFIDGQVAGNGNDAFQIREAATGTVIDQVGDNSGSGVNNYQDSYLYRVDDTGPDGGWVASNWNIPGNNTLDPFTAPADVAANVPFGTYSNSTCGGGPVTPTVSFDVDAAIVRESDGSYTITLTSSAIGSHTVDIVVSGGTATSGSDFAAFGPVTADFASSTTFSTTINIIDDNDNEIPENIAIGLTNASGAIIVTPNTLTLSILDNDVSGQVLQTGDLIFYGYDNQVGGSGADDLAILANLVEITSGTEFLYVNATYETGGFPENLVRTNRWYVCDETNFRNPLTTLKITYNGTDPIPAGSFFCLDLPGNSAPTITASTSGGTVPTSAFTLELIESDGDVSTFYSSTNISISNPDAVFLAQGDFAYTSDDGGYSLFEGRLLGGIQEGGTWYDLSDDLSMVSGSNRRRSRIPEEIRCFAIQGTATPGDYETIFNFSRLNTLYGAGPYTQRQLISAIVDFGTNWTTTGVSCPSTNFLSVGDPAVAGNWIGSTDENWFNCQNWDNLQVPGPETNVTIGSEAVENCEVNAASAFSDEYQDTARCNNLSITSATERLQIQSSASDVLVVSGDLSIANNGGLDMSSGSGVMLLSGNWDNQNATGGFTAGAASTVIFDGSSAQTLVRSGGGVAGETFANLELDNPAGLTINSPVDIKSTLTFTDGILTTASGGATAANLNDATLARLAFEDGATHTGASDASHVDGVVEVQTDNAFTLPIGDGTALHRVTLGAVTANFGSNVFRAEYFPDNPRVAIGPATAANVDFVSENEYWHINRTSGTGQRPVSLEITTTSGISNTAVAYIVRWNGGNWEQAGGDGNVNVNVAGNFMESDDVADFSPFTFADDGTSFPVELLDFTAVPQGEEVQLRWTTAQEVNNSHFVIERSLDRQRFEAIGQRLGAGNANKQIDYQFVDAQPQEGLNYYRLKQVDFDGSFTYSEVRSVAFALTERLTLLRAYPNPAQEQLTVELSLPMATTLQYDVIDAQGRSVMQQQVSLGAGLQSLTLPLNALSAGVYLLRLQADGQQLRQRFVRE